MAKKNAKNDTLYSAFDRQTLFNRYHNQFYNIWMSKFKVEGLDYRQNDFLFRKLWDLGTIAFFKRKYLDDLGLATYATLEYDYLDAPSIINLLQNRDSAGIIPTEQQTVDETVVIGWAQRSGEPIATTMDLYASKLAAIDMLLVINEKVQKMPWILKVEEGNEKKVQAFYNKLKSDEPTLFFDLDDIDPKALVSGAPYILDKLYNYKQAYMNEALTFLGVNNLGNIEKKERLITSEVDHNNELISSNNTNFTEPLKELIERVNDLFGQNLRLIDFTEQSPATQGEKYQGNDFNSFGRGGKEESDD